MSGQFLWMDWVLIGTELERIQCSAGIFFLGISFGGRRREAILDIVYITFPVVVTIHKNSNNNNADRDNIFRFLLQQHFGEQCLFSDPIFIMYFGRHEEFSVGR